MAKISFMHLMPAQWEIHSWLSW